MNIQLITIMAEISWWTIKPSFAIKKSDLNVRLAMDTKGFYSFLKP